MTNKKKYEAPEMEILMVSAEVIMFDEDFETSDRA